MKAMCPPNHTIISFPRDLQGRGLSGGIAFIHNLNLGKIHSYRIDCHSCEAAVFSFKFNSTTLNICCVYNYRRDVKMSLFLQELQSIITDLKLKNCPFLLTGDFNIHCDVKDST